MKIILDVDNVVADFEISVCKKYPELKQRDMTRYDFPIEIDWKELYADSFFWLALPVLDKPTVKIDGYISHRPFGTYITEFWLYVNGFKSAKVYHVNHSSEKVNLLRTLGCDIYIDDKPQTFFECRDANINAFVYHQPWNANIDTPHRIFKLKELENYAN